MDDGTGQRPSGLWSFVFALVVSGALLAGAFVAAGLALTITRDSRSDTLLYISGLTFAAGLGLAGLATVLDAAAGLAPRSLGVGLRAGFPHGDPRVVHRSIPHCRCYPRGVCC